MTPSDYARRLRQRADRAQAVIRSNPNGSEPVLAELREANGRDWAEIRAAGLRLAVCRELLRGYWDLRRLR